MNKTIKYGVLFLLVVAAIVYVVDLKFYKLKDPQLPAARPQGQEPSALPEQSSFSGQSGPLFSMPKKEEKLKGIDDNRISQDLEKAEKAQQDAILADAEAVKRSEIEEKKAQLELDKIEKAKAAAAKEAQK